MPPAELPGELTCPITHELLSDPVIAEDGHTYERAAIAKWYAQGKTRSPVTNEEITGTRLIPNLAVRKLVDQYRNDLGQKLLPLLEAGVDKRLVLELLQQGAQVNIRDDQGATPLLLAVSRGRLDLVHVLVEHGADPTLSNDKGENSVAAARRRRLDPELIDFLTETEKAFVSKHAAQAEVRARERTENRRQQETLRNDNMEAARNALPLVPGIGYFPSLFGLQFQAAISTNEVAPAYRQQDGPFWGRVQYFVDWSRFLLIGDADLSPGQHEDFKMQRLLSRVLAGLVALLIALLILL